MLKPIHCLLVVVFVLSGCSSVSPPAPPPTVTEITSPAGAGSEEPNLSAAPDGRVFMSWLEPAAPDGYKLLFSVRDTKGTWSEPRMIAGGDNWFVNDADFPSMTVLSDGSLAAHWLGNNAPGTEAYDVNIAMSHDGGATWGKPIIPHRDKTKSQHGFATLVPGPEGRLNVIWLDGRKTNEEGEGDMAVMHTTIEPDGTLGPETQLDNRACECCQTAAANTPNGMLVIYRDRSEQEIRDIALVRYANGAWSQPEPLSKEGWEIDGCPVNGPAISSDGSNVAAAWFTAANDQVRVYAALSTDSGKTFGNPIQVDDGKANGRVDVLSLASGGALVTWMERTDKGAQIRIRQIDPNGVARPSIAVSGASGVRSGAFARLERSGNQAVIAWTDSGDEPRVRAAVLAF
jgi:hypothetical protein